MVVVVWLVLGRLVSVLGGFVLQSGEFVGFFVEEGRSLQIEGDLCSRPRH